MTARVLIARLDSDGDVLLAGPAVRAVAASGAQVTLLVGPRGRHAAGLLPGAHDILVWHCPWIDAQPQPVDRADVDALVDRIAAGGYDTALVLTSFHQSPLPLALLLRMAGVPRIGAESEYYPGSLLDVRHRLPDTGLHEVERGLSAAAAVGFALPAGDDGRLRLRAPLPSAVELAGSGPYVVLHPGTSVPARGWAPARFAELAGALLGRGHRVLVTGSPAERPLTAAVAAGGATDLGGRTSLGELAAVLAGAAAVVVGNTGPAHLAAAVGAPVVSLFAPTVPAERWAPWTADRVVLGDQTIGCAGCRASDCPVSGHPCLSSVGVADVVTAVERLAAPLPATTGGFR